MVKVWCGGDCGGYGGRGRVTGSAIIRVVTVIERKRKGYLWLYRKLREEKEEKGIYDFFIYFFSILHLFSSFITNKIIKNIDIRLFSIIKLKLKDK